jgi:hypothetical protein
MWLTILRPLWPVIAGIALFGLAWWAYEDHAKVRYKAGRAEVMAEWQTSDKIALAVGAETTGLLKRNAAAQEGKFNDAPKTLAARNAASSADARSLRDKLTAIASAPASDPTPGPACRSYEREYRECSGLLSEGVGLAEEGGRLALETSAKLTALQAYAELVQSIK